MTTPVVNFQNIQKCYRMGNEDVYALKSVSLKIHRGEMVAIMGPSGSGKSTLMHLMGCLDKPSQGTYLLNGEDVSLFDDASLSDVRANQIGFIFQAFNLIPQLNVLENVLLPFSYQKRGQTDEQIALSAIKRVGLGHRLYHRPTELSGGEMQRVAIARALSISSSGKGTSLILADEPTGNLDFETSQSILNLFQELHQQGVTIILVTHSDLVASHCQRIIQIKDGAIIKDAVIL